MSISAQKTCFFLCVSWRGTPVLTNVIKFKKEIKYKLTGKKVEKGGEQEKEKGVKRSNFLFS